MQLWQDGIIALLAAIGLGSILWMIAKAAFFLPAARHGTVALICARGDASEIEQQVRSLSMLRRERSAVGEILLVDCGLTEEGANLCRLLARENRRVTLCRSGEIEKYIT